MTTKTVPAMQEIVGALHKTMGRGEVELNALRVLFIIASYDPKPVPQLTLRELTGLSEAAVSRNLAILGRGNTMDVPGPKLVETFEDPDNRKRRLCKLTSKGRNFMELIGGIVDKHTKED